MDVESRVRQEIQEVINDITEDQAETVARFLVSDVIGVRSLDRLHDVGLEDLATKLARCDARRLHRAWQTKFKPENIQQRRLIESNVSEYIVDWAKVAEATLQLLRKGKRPTKAQRSAMLRAIVNDVLFKFPNANRAFFSTVAESMVKDFPRALQDRGMNASPLQCDFLKQKLKCTYDEARRARVKRSQEEAPRIPEAYGCKQWRVANFPPNETQETLLLKKQELLDMYENIRRRNWDWLRINQLMDLTFKLQREDINSQVPVKRRRASGAAHQPVIEPKSTEQIWSEWPFLFQPQGMLVHFKLLTKVDFVKALQDFENRIDRADFIKFLSEYGKDNKKTYKLYKRACRRNDVKPDCTAICLMLINAFKEKTELLIMEIEAGTDVDDIEQVIQLPPNPCILSFGPVFEASKFMISIDSKPISAMREFWMALSSVFMVHYVLNLKYTPRLGNTLEFYQRVVAGIDDRGSKIDGKKNYRSKWSEKLRTLIDAYEQHQDSSEEENEENVDEPMSVSD